MDSVNCFLNEFDRCLGNAWTMCEFHDFNANGFGDIWWTAKLTYFSSIDGCLCMCVSACDCVCVGTHVCVSLLIYCCFSSNY